MTTIITASLTTTGTNITLANGVDLFVAPTAVRVSSIGTAISAVFAGHAIDILGTIYGEDGGIALGATLAADTSSTITLGAAASVVSRGDAIRSQGETVNIFNDGLIKGGTAIDHDGIGFFRLVNTGNVIGTIADAIQVEGDRGAIINHGVIESLGGWGISLNNNGSVLATMSIRNHGFISGSDGAILGADQVRDSVQNHGTIGSNVALLGGDDDYNGQGGVVTGEVSGGDGNDTLIGGALRDGLAGDDGDDTIEGGGSNDFLTGGEGADTIDGGEGNDLIRPGAGADVIDGGAGLRDVLSYDFGSAGVTVDLATGDASGGDAAGDIFTEIEDVIGTGLLDVLTGNGLVNRLFGRQGGDLLAGAGGNDVLAGDDGADTLLGGAGADVLRGGTGADLFRLASAAESGATGGLRDRIADFNQGEGDRIDLSALDANATLAGNQAFVFNPGATFTGPGQLRAQVIGGNTFVFGNNDATNATAEFSLVLNGVVALSAADFIL